MCLYTRVHKYKLLGYLMRAQVWDGHLESQKNSDRLKCIIHVNRIGVHSICVYMYAVLRVLMIWTNCFFPSKMSFLFRKVEDGTTISKCHSLTSVSIKDCTLRVPSKIATLILYEQFSKQISLHVHVHIVRNILPRSLCCWPRKSQMICNSTFFSIAERNKIDS